MIAVLIRNKEPKRIKGSLCCPSVYLTVRVSRILFLEKVDTKLLYLFYFVIRTWSDKCLESAPEEYLDHPWRYVGTN